MQHMGEASPDCLKCMHFYVTWDPAFPRGCRIFQIKTRNMPSWDVRSATGRACPAFEARTGKGGDGG
jgi:hypothetical protein